MKYFVFKLEIREETLFVFQEEEFFLMKENMETNVRRLAINLAKIFKKEEDEIIFDDFEIKTSSEIQLEPLNENEVFYFKNELEQRI